jgi:hypothetical protein
MRQGKERNAKCVVLSVIALLITVAFVTPQQGFGQEDSPKGCTLATLKGQYLFDASGYNIVNSIATPKAVVEFLTFKGDGNLSSLGTVSLGGTIHSGVSDSGIYTVNKDCTGTLTFTKSGFTFDIFIAASGSRFHMIETVTNTVLAGEVQRVAR